LLALPSFLALVENQIGYTTANLRLAKAERFDEPTRVALGWLRGKKVQEENPDQGLGIAE